MDSWEKYPGCVRRIWGNSSTYCCWIFSAPWISSLVCSTFVFTFFCTRDNKIKRPLTWAVWLKTMIVLSKFLHTAKNYWVRHNSCSSQQKKTKKTLENKTKEWLQRKTRWRRSSQMCSTSLSMDTSGIHLQMQNLAEHCLRADRSPWPLERNI